MYEGEERDIRAEGEHCQNDDYRKKPKRKEKNRFPLLGERRQEQCRLHHRERCAETGARTDPERQIGEAACRPPRR